MNILVLTGSAKKGGTERIFSNLINGLNQARENYNITLLVLQGEIEFDYELNCKTICLKSSPPKSILSFFFYFFNMAGQVRQIKKKENINITISFFNVANIINILSMKGDKVILVIQNFLSEKVKDFGFLKGNIFKYFIKYFYNLSDGIVVPSKGMVSDLTKNFGIKKNKIKVIYNFINKDKILRCAKEDLGKFSSVFNSPVLINVGRLERQKNQKSLIKIFKLVKNSIPEAKLIILGEGKLESSLVKLSEELKLRIYKDREDDGNSRIMENFDVYFLGFQDNPFKFIAGSDLFLLTSVFESFGFVLVESMICSTPVISTDCGSGPREIIAPETSFLYKTKMPEYAKYGILMPVLNTTSYEQVWAREIIKLLKNRETLNKYSSFGLKRAGQFNSDKIIPAWISYLDQVAN